MVNLEDLPPQKPELGITLVKADLEDNIYPQPKPYVPTDYKGGWIGLTQKARHKFSAGQPQWEKQSNINQNASNNEGKACTLPARHQYNNYWPSWDDETANDCEDQGAGGNTWKFEDHGESESDHWTTEGRKLIPTKDYAFNNSTERDDTQDIIDGQDKSDEYQQQDSIEQDGGSKEEDEEREENIHRYDSSQSDEDHANVISHDSLKTEKDSIKSDQASKGSGDADENSDKSQKRSWDEIADALTGNSDEEQRENSTNKEGSNDLDGSTDLDCSDDDSVDAIDSDDSSHSDELDDSHSVSFETGDEVDTVSDIDQKQPPSPPKSPSSSLDDILRPPPPPGPTMPLVVYVFKAIRDIFWCILGP